MSHTSSDIFDIFLALRSILLFEYFSHKVLMYCIVIKFLPISVTSLSTAWVCDRSLGGIAGSNPAGA
jgi:hypothetical protein